MIDLKQIEEFIIDVPDFPKKGIVFKDITPIFENHVCFVSLVRHFARAIPEDTTKLIGIESRGFLLGAAIAQHLNVGLVLARKPGKLPRQTQSQTYSLEYGEDELQIHTSSIAKNDKVVIIDDILATGGTAQAAESLCLKMGADVLGSYFLMQISALKGKDKLTKPVHSFLQV
ncbi:MAG: adenine phosphoribosyltransferase [Bdellovibrionales bacterium]|nr:adenine phosphoribosyltransferase [Bdellovibrionales bacterium]